MIRKPRDNRRGSPSLYTLSVLSIFKNEDDVLEEWLEHYIAEGVEHFYLIDNGTGGINPMNGGDRLATSDRILSKYPGRITLLREREKGAQRKHYNTMLARIQTDWLMVVDLDEFVYARREHRSVKAYLFALGDSGARTSQVLVAWKMFGSNGHVKQPGSITRGFTRREEIPEEGILRHVKAIVRPVDLIFPVDVHWNAVHGTTIEADGKIFSRAGRLRWFWNTLRMSLDKNFLRRGAQLRLTAEGLANSDLHCNHYVNQSKEWYENVKAKRGAADSVANDSLRTMLLFDESDPGFNAREDSELARKRGQD